MQSYNQTWDLDVFFPGGSSSPEFAQYISKLDMDVQQLLQHLQHLHIPQSAEDGDDFQQVVERLQDVQKRIAQAMSFVGCLMAQDTKDKKAVLLNGQVKSLYAQYSSVWTLLDKAILKVDADVWSQLLRQAESLQGIAFPLNERRTQAIEKLPPEQEVLVNDLAVDGYHAWESLYDTTVGRMSIPLEENGETAAVSVGQAANKLASSKREERAAVFQKWEEAWAEQADFCADALNHLAGFRLAVYKHRGWNSVLKEPLAINRMSEQTLQTMWDVIDRNKDIFVQYLHRKAKLLGLERLSWHDVSAPLGKTTKQVSYAEAAEFILQHFQRFSPKMAAFAEQAFRNRWIEAEDRPGKRPGGFCTGFPVSGQTRIFLTFSGTSSNVSTLAHELGHGYHQYVMEDMPALAQNYAMNVAETASTFAEMIVSDAALRQAASDEERIVLLDEKVERAVAFFMNIHARFLFETSFYEERKNGLVDMEMLSQLMMTAQKTAYKDALAEYHPHFWASKLHFYITDVPFYNFPYTFGFLFSSGIYAQALQEGASFEDRYVALLRDTGSMTVEELAAKHLRADLTKPDFWQSAVDVSIADARQFLELTK
ncbi:M3 family oligoendopeptidase [Fodinisporobacter ferrooxydans]|uniref:M3 family oligoendopeptidase n=1 Tax=Fodinisporobacter ferrooxydans TaxID=2901836 RepID=A0ABY4CM52_9BACL|nr:M3 family oligoendopeptidase [Alicyclobacillaceae bacterium MYW30-H2]